MPRQYYLPFFLAALLSVTAAASADPLGNEAKEPIRILPEAERLTDFCILGVDPDDGNYFCLPKLDEPKSKNHKAGWNSVERQFYWLDFELSHGALLTKLPMGLDLYIGYPSPAKNPASQGREPAWMREYLQQRCGWTAAQVQEHAHFFEVETPLIWPQDAGEALGLDAAGRLVIGYGPEDQDFYHQFVDALTRSYPDRFAVKFLDRGVSSEGGDLAIVRRPDGKPGLVLGRHRVLRYLELAGRGDFKARPVPPALIDEAKAAYAHSYRLPVQVVPEKALREGWGSEELFHLDMLATFVASGEGTQALVPDFVQHGVDSFSGTAFDQRQRQVLDREYDQVAAELAQAGYRVLRLPLNDNPVRSPANTLKFMQPDHRRDVVYLARFPDTAAAAGGAPSPASRLQAALAGLRAQGERWNATAGHRDVAALQRAVGDVWRVMREASAQPNRVFEEQSRTYRQTGCLLIEVPDYPWGAGSLHCQTLH